jgi:hypothetical protein
MDGFDVGLPFHVANQLKKIKQQVRDVKVEKDGGKKNDSKITLTCSLLKRIKSTPIAC